MTTEEFEGHLMAVLHGPNAEKIAARIFSVALSDKAIATALVDVLVQAIGVATDETDEAVSELALLAHLSALRPKPGDTVADTMMVSQRRHTALQRVRARLAASVRKHPDAERIAETFMLDLSVAVQPAGD